MAMHAAPKPCAGSSRSSRAGPAAVPGSGQLQPHRQQRPSPRVALRRRCYRSPRTRTAGRRQMTKRPRRTMTLCLRTAGRCGSDKSAVCCTQCLSCAVLLAATCCKLLHQSPGRPWHRRVSLGPRLACNGVMGQGGGAAGGPVSKSTRCLTSRAARPGAQPGRGLAEGDATPAAGVKKRGKPSQPTPAPSELPGPAPSSGEGYPLSRHWHPRGQLSEGSGTLGTAMLPQA